MVALGLRAPGSMPARWVRCDAGVNADSRGGGSVQSSHLNSHLNIGCGASSNNGGQGRGQGALSSTCTRTRTHSRSCPAPLRSCHSRCGFQPALSPMPPRLSSCLPHRRTARFRPSASPASRRLHHHPPRGAGVARVPFCLSRKLIIAASPPPACFKVQPMSPRFLRQFSSLHMWAIRPGPPLNTIVHRSASHIVIVYALISNNAVRFLACAQPPACMLCIVALTVNAANSSTPTAVCHSSPAQTAPLSSRCAGAFTRICSTTKPSIT